MHTCPPVHMQCTAMRTTGTHICCTLSCICLHMRTRAHTQSCTILLVSPMLLPPRLLQCSLHVGSPPGACTCDLGSTFAPPRLLPECTCLAPQDSHILLLPGTGVLGYDSLFFTAEIGKKKSICCHCSILVNDCGEGEIPAHKAQFHWERDFPWKEPRCLVSDLGRETE